MDTPDLDRLTLLERAQLLHDATLRRHGEMLDRQADDMAAMKRLSDQQLALNDQLSAITARLGHEQGISAEIVTRLNRGQALHDVILEHLAQEQALHRDAMALHAERLARYDAILTRLDAESARHAERLARLDQILQAIRDMLERGNGH